MTQEDKELLLKDLCTRLPYGTICQIEDEFRINDSKFYDSTLSERHIELFRNHKGFYIKPYLRPMSSMTEEEKEKFNEFIVIVDDIWKGDLRNGFPKQSNIMSDGIDYLTSVHIDYRGLIPKGLAIEVTEEDNPYKRIKL